MGDRITTKDAVKNRQQQAGGVMYDGQPAGDDLFGDGGERPWHYTPTGLAFDRKLTRDEYRNRLLPELQVMESARQLIIGDACLEGIEDGHIESYEDMAELTGYTAGTIELYASLCRSIPRLVRTNSLTYSHYQKIAPLPEEERPLWIKFAADSELSYRALDALIQWTKGNPQLPAPVDDMTVFPDEPDDDRPALSDEMEAMALDNETVDLTDAIYEKTVIGFRKKASQNRYAEIDLTEILRIETWLMTLRKKVAQAKVDAGRQARMAKK